MTPQVLFDQVSGQPSEATLTIAKETLLLSAARVVVWPARRTLFAADLHVGKAATFRAMGVPVPAGTTRGTLDRLSDLLKRYAIERLVILGDFLHSARGKSVTSMQTLRDWRAQWPGLAIDLIEGNHDKHAGHLPSDLNIRTVQEPYRMGPIAACHIPQVVPDAFVLAGHVHPCIHMGEGRADRVRLPCFWQQADHGLTLPAFGDFTGMYAITTSADDKVWPLVSDFQCR